jgi:hypothetical protein
MSEGARASQRMAIQPRLVISRAKGLVRRPGGENVACGGHTEAHLHIKPMGLDPILWQIVDVSKAATVPLSFRLFGLSCWTPAWAETDILEDSDRPEAIAQQAIPWAETKLAEVLPDLTPDMFLQSIRDDPHQKSLGLYLQALVTALILTGRRDEARTVCASAIEQGHSGGLGIHGKTFPQLALAWLLKTNAERESN